MFIRSPSALQLQYAKVFANVRVFAMCSTMFRECLTSLNKTGECIVIVLIQAEISLVSFWTIDTKVVCCYI